MDLKAIGLALVGLVAAVVFLARADAERDVAAPSLFDGLMTATDRMVLGADGPKRNRAALPDGSQVAAGEVFTSYRVAGKRDAPRHGAFLAPLEGCAPRGVADGDIVHAFATGPARALTSLYPFRKGDLTDDVDKLIRWRMKGDLRPLPVSRGTSYAMRAVDVAVTETGAPVVLVLQTTLRGVIWNIHAAPEAMLSRVVLLGGDHVAVSGLPDGVEVEVMTRAELGACGLSVSFPPPSDHVIHRSVEMKIREAEASLAAWRVRDREWADWVRARFGTGPGLPPEEEALTAFVAGPVPAAAADRAVFRPLNEGILRMTEPDHLLSGTDWQTQYRAAVAERAEAIAGQPLDALLPVTVTGASR